MCGIVGYVGPRKALPILLQNLNLLTYRGYDSAGVAVIGGGDFYVEKTAGKVSDLEALVGDAEVVEGSTGIGHTRWATHGEPTTLNAHPHGDCHGRIMLVHNGIIENYYALKEELHLKGHAFVSETDTEILFDLVRDIESGNAAVEKMLNDLVADLDVETADNKNKTTEAPEQAAPEQFNIIIECDGENQQKELFERFRKEQLKCRLLTL